MFFFEKRKIKHFLLIVYFIFAFIGAVFAEYRPNIHIGSLEIHPFTSITQIFDSNIFLEPEGEEDDDFVTDLEIGIKAMMPLYPPREDDFMIEAEYRADLIEFWENNHDNRVDHTAKGALNFIFSNDFRLEVKDSFYRTADPQNSELTNFEQRYRNVFDAILAYDRKKIRFKGSIRITRDGYDNLDNLSKTDNMYTGAIFYQISPKVSVFTEYNHGAIEYDNNRTNSDSDYNQIRLGVEGILRPKLRGLVKAGYREVNYNERDKAEFAGFAFYGNLKYNATRRTEMNLYAERTSEESSFSPNSHYEINRIGLKLNHRLSVRTWFIGEAYHQINEYPEQSTIGPFTAKREDKIWGFDAGLKYEYREWWFIRIGYGYQQRDPNFDVFDYKDHRISAQLMIKL